MDGLLIIFKNSKMSKKMNDFLDRIKELLRRKTYDFPGTTLNFLVSKL